MKIFLIILFSISILPIFAQETTFDEQLVNSNEFSKISDQFRNLESQISETENKLLETQTELENFNVGLEKFSKTNIVEINQEPTFLDYFLVSILFATGAMTAISAGLMRRSANANSNLAYAQLMEHFTSITSKTYVQESELHEKKNLSVDAWERFATDFTNILDDMAFLHLNDKGVDKIMIEHYKSFFAFSLHLLDWKEMVFDNDAKNSWSRIIEISEKYNITRNDFNRKISPFMESAGKLYVETRLAHIEKEKLKNQNNPASQDKTQQDSESKS